MWINQGDIILLGLRDFEPGKADVLLKYTADEARNLKTYGELPENGASAVFYLPRVARLQCEGFFFKKKVKAVLNTKVSLFFPFFSLFDACSQDQRDGDVWPG